MLGITCYLDNTKNIQLAANVLKSTNLYSIYFATSGEKALEQLALRDYSLILLDINMPKKDGLYVLRFLKSQQNFKKIPIIMITAVSKREIVSCTRLTTQWEGRI